MSERETEQGSLSKDDQPREIFVNAAGRLNVDQWPFGFPDLSELVVSPGFEWVQIGPAPLKANYSRPQPGGGLDDVPDDDSGQVTEIAIDPSGSADQIMYVATDAGGIWKTTDGGLTWLPKSDFMPSLSMGAVALDPSNGQIVYAGTGNLFDPGGVFAKGVGLYKSIDGGETWAHVDGGIFGTIFGNVGINRIVLPASDSLLVATDKGLFRSVDGGLNFGAAPQFNNGRPILDGYITTLRLDTATPTTVYAAVSGEGVFRSTDTGATFPTNLFTAGNGAPTKPYSAIAFAQSMLDKNQHPNNSVLYASVQLSPPGRAPTYVGLFLSTDAGANWKHLPQMGLRIAKDAVTQRQTVASLTLGVDPQNSDRIYLGFEELWLSDDGGTTFPISDRTSGRVHVDHHALVFSPTSHLGTAPTPPTRLYVGTDGGITKSEDGGVNWANLSGNIASNLFLAMDIGRGPGRNEYAYGGMQDQGVAGHRPADGAFPADPPRQWRKLAFGDSGQVAVDADDPKIVYGSIGDEFFKMTARGEKLFQVRAVQIVSALSASPTSPIEIKSLDHGFRNDQIVFVDGVSGNTAANSTWRVTNRTADTFQLVGAKGTAETSQSNGIGSGGTVALTAFVAVTDATNTAPIEITAPEHPFLDGDIVFVGNVKGNLAANGRWKIKLTTSNKFQLLTLAGSNSQGNGAYLNGGLARGPSVGRKLETQDGGQRRIALAQAGPSPATRVVYYSEKDVLYRSANAGIEFSKVYTPGDEITAVATRGQAPRRLWVGLKNGEVHLSTDEGATWDGPPAPSKPFQTKPGPGLPVAGIAIDPTNTSRVAIVFSGFSGINPAQRTRHCFLTSDDGHEWADISGTDGGGSTSNLPDIPLRSVVWDKSTNPPRLVVASDAGVAQSTDLGATWHVLGVNLPTVSCQSLAIDDSVTPPVLRVGTYGRSCFELRKSAGRHLVVRSNLAFGTVAAGQSPVLPMQLFNVGDADLEIITVGFLSGSNLLEMTPPLPVPFTLHVNEMRACLVRFTPAGTGNHTATFIVISNDDVQTLREVQASGSSIVAASAPRLAVDANLTFGRVSMVIDRTLPIQASNTGLGPLIIKKISRTGGSTDFELVSPPTFPLPPLQPGEKRDLTVRFKPSSAGPLDATFEIESDDLISRDGKPAGTRTIKATGVGKSKAGNHLAKVLIALGIIVALGATALVVKDLED